LLKRDIFLRQSASIPKMTAASHTDKYFQVWGLISRQMVRTMRRF